MQTHYKYNGFINIYKESGWTSMDVCAKLKGILGVRRIGHAGTLDPMAEGVLPVAVGRATKDIDMVGGEVKEYTAGMLLGTETDTEDITGSVISSFAGELPDEEKIRKTVMSFIGRYDQLTPMYSARKINGKKLYEYARAGIEVERKTKNIEIFSIIIESVEIPHVTFTVICSKGTYVRTLCSDIGRKLGCGACMESLRRNRVGRYCAEDAVKISELADIVRNGNADTVLSIASPTAVSIGKFDGTHIGHQALLKELRKKAEKDHLRTLVIILKFGNTGVLSDSDRKNKLYDLGIDYCVELQFTEELKAMSAEDFLEKILIGRFNMKAIVAGTDVSFGRGKAGNAAFLYANSEKYGYSVDLINKVRTDELISGSTADESPRDISSTLLREMIRNGDMAKASRLLGEPYCITGTVVHGKGIAGPEMKYPTMNIEVPDELTLPPFGVYAVKTYISPVPFFGNTEKASEKTADVRTVLGIANLGERPTVNGSIEGGSRLRLEVHAFEELGDCYGMTAKVELCRFIRPEVRFGSISELVTEIKEHDIPETKAFFGIE